MRALVPTLLIAFATQLAESAEKLNNINSSISFALNQLNKKINYIENNKCNKLKKQQQEILTSNPLSENGIINCEIGINAKSVINISNQKFKNIHQFELIK